MALVSCLVWREKSEAGGRVAPELEGPLAALREAARRVAKVGQMRPARRHIDFTTITRVDWCHPLRGGGGYN